MVFLILLRVHMLLLLPRTYAFHEKYFDIQTYVHDINSLI